MRRLATALGIVLLRTAGFLPVAPLLVDARMNRVAKVDLPPVPAEAQRLHRSLRIADLHNDFLLWSRDPKRHASRGHSDLPRLRQAKSDCRCSAS